MKFKIKLQPDLLQKLDELQRRLFNERAEAIMAVSEILDMQPYEIVVADEEDTDE